MEYIDLVNKIVAAEHSAKEITREAKDRETSLDADLGRETAEMRTAYMARAKRRVAQVRQTEQESARESIAALDEKLRGTMDAVEAAYARRREEWVDALFSRIVDEQV